MCTAMPMRNVLLTALACMVLLGAVALASERSVSAGLTAQRIADNTRSDEPLKYAVEVRLRTDGRIDWEVLDVDVRQRHVTLYGEVLTQDEKGLATLIASTVPGVKSMTNSIIVDSAHSKDYRLRKAVWSALRGVDALREQILTLRVIVKHAVVTLSGSVEGSLQKETAVKAAQSVQGVNKVANAIKVQPKRSKTERERLLKQGIEPMP